jgi:Skp family chaperone for outer membrane proteins
MRSLMSIKQMRDYEIDFFRKKAIEDVLEATKRAARTVAESQGYNLVLSGEDARVVGLIPSIEITAAVVAAMDAPDDSGAKKKPGKDQKPSTIATAGVRQLWGQLQKLKPKSEPGSEIPAAGMKFVESAGLQLLLDEEVLVYANPARSRTAELGKKLSGE